MEAKEKIGYLKQIDLIVVIVENDTMMASSDPEDNGAFERGSINEMEDNSTLFGIVLVIKL